MRRVAAATAAVASAAAGVYAAERLSVQRLAWNPDPTALSDFSRPRGRSQTVSCTDGTQLATVSIGSGPTIVLCHGYTASLANWALVAPLLLEAGHQVVMFDQRGHGESTVGSEGFDIAQLGSDLANVLEQLDLDQTTVVGHSMGGIGLLSLLVNHADTAARRVAGAVYLSTLATSVGYPLGTNARLGLLKSGLFDRARNNDLHGLFFTSRIFGENPALSQVEAALDLARQCPLETVFGALVPLIDFDLRSRIGLITQPSIVVCGTQDNVTSPASSQYLANALNADLYWLEGAGHATPFERFARVAELTITHAARSN